jgi:hypothetical protein
MLKFFAKKKPSFGLAFFYIIIMGSFKDGFLYIVIFVS